jgi:S-DNA-T family DNA segregation ATPase FtsK/SpoIIIE
VGARDAKVRVIGPGRLVVELFYGDPLEAVIPAPPLPALVDVAAVPVGVCEDGTCWTLRVQGNHVLVAGATDSGKSCLLWSLLRSLAPAIHAGLVDLRVIDPKGGMEMTAGRALFGRLEPDPMAGYQGGEVVEAMADLLDDTVAVMQARARRLAGVTRKHTPTVGDPLIVVVIDELAYLTAYLHDSKLRSRITQAISLLLTQGRAVGVSVVGALQDPRKEVVAFRQLFPTRIALRLDEPAQVDMVLGDGSRELARCHLIPRSLPGVGYVRIDGVREPLRVRAAWVTDADIAALSERYPAPARLAAEAERGEVAA